MTGKKRALRYLSLASSAPLLLLIVSTAFRFAPGAEFVSTTPPEREEQSAETPPALEGKGTAESPFLIDAEEKLRLVEKFPNSRFLLTANLELRAPWRPLCAQISFNGTFDGNNKEIKGLEIIDEENSGLFAYVGEKGRIINLTVSGQMKLAGATRRAGGIAATLNGVVNNVVSKVDVTIDRTVAPETPIGGLAGQCFGIIAFSDYEGTMIDERSPKGRLGGIVGLAKPTNTSALPEIVTAHAGFAAKGGVRDGSEDNTIANIVKAIAQFSPNAIEVDVRNNSSGVLVISHNKSEADRAPTLESAFKLLMGETPSEHDQNALDPEKFKSVRIQLDAKEDRVLLQELDLIKKTGFPLDRVIMAGDVEYETVLANVDAIREAVNDGLDFWMNPNRIDSYENMSKKSDSFLEKIDKLGLANFTVNSSYQAMTEDVREWLESNGVKVSIWTLNDEKSIKNNMFRGVKNVTSRLPLIVEVRDSCATRGVYGNTVRDENMPEVGFVDSAP